MMGWWPYSSSSFDPTSFDPTGAGRLRYRSRQRMRPATPTRQPSDESRAQASGYQGGGDESVLLETAVVVLKGLSKQ